MRLFAALCIVLFLCNACGLKKNNVRPGTEDYHKQLERQQERETVN